MREPKPLGPWTELGRVVAEKPKRPKAHPPEPFLIAYLQGKLPHQPTVWTEGRVQAMHRGQLEAWTEVEIRAHLALCLHCRRKLLRWQGVAVPQPILRREKLWANRHLAWALAGAQALALAGVILWFTLSPTPSPTKPEFSLPSEFTQPPGVTAYLVPKPEITVAQLSSALQTHGIVIVNGPDEMGRYLVMGEEQALDAISTTEVVESITIKRR
ncbi:MAG: hypothetical protein NZ651_05265 [Candidatus Bipolaricaulota bacterium]|nr:hypothetical protein [Candidatus Bipolaricaulota bacterium]MDW8127162.1 hypothetical protein [Candidatus Bipolaricaulota bacterium]